MRHGYGLLSGEKYLGLGFHRDREVVGLGSHWDWDFIRVGISSGSGFHWDRDFIRIGVSHRYVGMARNQNCETVNKGTCSHQNNCYPKHAKSNLGKFLQKMQVLVMATFSNLHHILKCQAKRAGKRHEIAKSSIRAIPSSTPGDPLIRRPLRRSPPHEQHHAPPTLLSFLLHTYYTVTLLPDL